MARSSEVSFGCSLRIWSSAGAFFVSSGMQMYFYLAKIPIPLMWTNAIQLPELSGVRGTIHFMLFLICLYFGWFFHR
jgi:hypothetical protein